MAKVDLHSPIEALSGSLNKDAKYTFRRTRRGKGGRTILIKKADMSNVEWSPDQTATRGHFSEAVAFAKSVLADPEFKKQYQKKGQAERDRCLSPGHLGIQQGARHALVSQLAYAIGYLTYIKVPQHFLPYNMICCSASYYCA